MLKLTQLVGFGGAGGGTDVTPNPIDFFDISDAAIVASAATNPVVVSGIDTAITLRLTLTTGMTSLRVVDVYRDSVFVAQGVSGTTVDVSITNGQTLSYNFTNSQNNTTWFGTATVTNVSDGDVVLDTFSYTLQDTGTGGVGVGGVGGPIP